MGIYVVIEFTRDLNIKNKLLYQLIHGTIKKVDVSRCKALISVIGLNRS